MTNIWHRCENKREDRENDPGKGDIIPGMILVEDQPGVNEQQRVD